MGLKRIWCYCVDCINVTEYRRWWRAVVILVTDSDVPLRVEKFVDYFANISFTKPVIHSTSNQMNG
jgi:hypothetical protein